MLKYKVNITYFIKATFCLFCFSSVYTKITLFCPLQCYRKYLIFTLLILLDNIGKIYNNMTTIVSRLIKSKDKTSTVTSLPDFGPVEINDYNDYLKNSRNVFMEKWNSSAISNQLGRPPPYLKDFLKIKIIGSGSFGRVYLVQNKLTNHYHAMKAISKDIILKYNQLEHTRTEKMVLYCNNCPFTLRLEFYFIDNSYIYFIVPFVQGGELYSHLRKMERFDEFCCMFYVAQVILALEYLHFVDIIYRDLKPENILVDHTGYLKLADFGFCKQMTKGRTYTLCGTPEYLAPEVILSKGYGKSVDWWGVGILAYELASGFTPFKEKKAIKVYENVLRGTYKMPTHFSSDLKDFVKNILQADTSKRYGNLKNGVNDLKDHKWFRPLNWQAVVSRKLAAPYSPTCEGPEDTRNFRRHSYQSLVVDTQDTFRYEFENF